MITIHVNDESIQFPQPIRLLDFLAARHNDNQDIASAAFAVALNGEFVPRSLYAQLILNHGDALDIVSPVGGG